MLIIGLGNGFVLFDAKLLPFFAYLYFINIKATVDSNNSFFQL